MEAIIKSYKIKNMTERNDLKKNLTLNQLMYSTKINKLQLRNTCQIIHFCPDLLEPVYLSI